MWTLKVKVLDGAGKPASAALVDLLNTDDSSRYTDSRRRSSTEPPRSACRPATTVRSPTSTDLRHGGRPHRATRGVDHPLHRKQEQDPDPRQPQGAAGHARRRRDPTVTDGSTWHWQRVSAAGAGADSQALMGPGIAVYEAPSDYATVGELHFGAVFDLSSPAASASPYTYSLAFPADGAVPADQHYRASAATLATLHARYFTDVAGRTCHQRVGSPCWATGSIGFQFAQSFATAADPHRVRDRGSGRRVAGQRGAELARHADHRRAAHLRRRHHRNVDWFHGPLVPGFGATPAPPRRSSARPAAMAMPSTCPFARPSTRPPATPRSRSCSAASTPSPTPMSC